jgi:hypothetical protein
VGNATPSARSPRVRPVVMSAGAPTILLVMRLVPFVLLLVVLLGGCKSTDRTTTTAASQPPDPTAAPFEQRRTLDCLRRAGATVARLEPANSELRAVRDLAQRTSFQVQVDGELVALVFGRDVAAAVLLEELVAVPDSAYATTRRGNVVVLYRRDEPSALRRVAVCLSS